MLPLPRGAVWQLLFLFCAALYINGVRADGRVVCYYTNWSVYRPGTAKFNPQNINPYLCTHLIYAFGGFTKDNQMKPFDKYQDIEQGGYAKFTGLKTYNKQLKTMIAIGGWNEASSRFSPLVANSERRQKFIKNILKFLRQNHFDGIDLDWEYPAHREGGKPRDRDNYAQFVQELRAEFERESEKTGRPRLLLTMAVPAGIEYIEKGYDIPKLNKYLDWFNLLTYDFHSSHEPSVNHHAPLYSLEEESEYNYDAELNIDYSIKFYLNAGADRDKLVLGIPTYGRSFTLINEESTEIGAPAEAPGDQGDATREKGYLAYYEICQNIKEDPEWTVVQPNPNAMGPYAYRRNQWVGYDDEAIVRKKAQYVVDNGLGGIMFWAIDNDDFRGTCTGKPYPLIEAAKDAMLDALGLGINEVSKPSAPQKPSRSRSRENSSSTRNRITTTEHKLTYAERKGSSKRTQSTQQTTRNRQQSTTTAAPLNIKLTEAEGSSLYVGGRTTTPPPPTTPDPGTDFKCEEEGFFQHPRDCKKYYWCLDSGPSGLGIVAHQFTCPSGLYFNPAADSCDFARNVPCKSKKSTTPPPITSPATTTTARPTSSFNRITAATSRPTTFFRTTPRTTTTTEAPEEEIEYEEEEDNPPSPFAKPKGFDKESEEDPKVIKELIELIRKVGGIEELEKHLLRKDDGTIAIKENSSSSSSSQTATTPSSISKSLYEKVLSKPNALSSFRNRFTSTSSFRTTKTQVKAQDSTEAEEAESHETDSKSSGASAGFSKYSSVLRGNSRQGPQSEGLEKLSEFDGFLKEKKQYTTINRNRGVKKTTTDEEEEDISSKTSAESHEDDEAEEEVSVKSTRRPYAASTPAYSTIRRTRPSTTTEATDEEEQEEKDVSERKSYSSLNRSRLRGTTTTELPDVTEVTAGSSRYKYLERTRPTRPTTESSNKVTDEEDTDVDNESENQENTVHFKAVNIENTRETQQEITTNTQRTYASIGRRTTTSTTAIPETETTTSAAKTRLTTTTAATPTTTTTSTTETPLTTPLTILETTTPESILITTNIPITTTTNPTTTTTSTTKTTTTSSPNDEDVLESLTTTTPPNPNEISSDISETLNLSQNINSLLTDSTTTITTSSSNSTPTPTTESGLDTNEQEIDSQLTTTETTLSTTTTINDSDNLTKTEDKEQEEVNLVSKQRNKTLYTTRTRTTTTTLPTTTTTNSVIETTPSPTNAKKPLGVRRQQILLNRSSQTKTTTSSVTTTDIPITTTTESVNNDFLGTVSSPRPFGFPKRRNRPTNAAGLTTTEETVVKSNDESLVTKQKTTKLNAAANSQTKKYQFQRRTTTTKTTSTTTTTTTTTTEKPQEVQEADEATKEGAAKAQVNVNDDSERETSTNIPETTAPITTESPSSPATPLQRRIKVLKLKRPVVTNVNNTNTNTNINITANANASSATNLNASHTETQNIVKLSSVSEVDSQIAKTQTLTETEITETTQTAIPSQTSPTPKRFRKVIRKLIRPVNRTTESPKETDSETSTVTTSTFLQRRPNATRLGFNRNSKFNIEKDEDRNAQESEESSEEDEDEQTEDKKTENITNRGRNRVSLPSGVTSTTRTSLFGTANRNRFASSIQSSSTTEDSKTTENNEEDEEVEDGDDEDDEEDEDSEEEAQTTTTSKPASGSIYTSTNRFRLSRPSASTTESTTETKEENESTITSELETTTHNEDDESQSSKETTATRLLNLQKLRNKVTSEQVTQQEEGVLSNRFKTTRTGSEAIESDDPLLKLRNKVKQDLAKGNQEEGVLSNRFKSTKVASGEEELEKDDPLLKLRNKVKLDLAKVEQVEGVLSDRFKTSKVASEEEETENPLLKLRNKIKQDLAKGNQVEGVLSDRLKSNKSESEVEVEEKEDNLLKLRNKVKQELAKGSQEEGVVSVKFKKLLENKNTSSVNHKVEETESDSSTQDSLNLLKIRDKVQTNLAKGEQAQGVVNSRLKKLLAERTSSTIIRSNSVEEDDEHDETTTEIKETSGDGDLLESSKLFTPRKPFVPRTRLTAVDNESQTQTEAQSEEVEESTTSAPRVRPTFRRKLVAKRPYVPTKPPLSALRTTTIKIPTTKGKKKYVRRKFGRFHPFNASNRNTGEGFVRTDPRGNILPGTDRYKVEGSAGGQSGEDYEEYDEEEGGEEEDQEEEEEVEKVKASVLVKPVQTIKPIISRPPGLFNRPQSTILKKPLDQSKEQGSGDSEDEDEAEAEEEEDEDEDEDEEEDEDENAQDAEKSIINRPAYKPKDNRIPPGARPSLTTTPTIKKPFTPSRVANTPYRPGAITTTTPSNRANRFGVSSRSTVKPRVINRPLGVSVPNLTIKPVANDYERTTVLIPTKPAPFINPNTRAYERKYTGPTTEASADLNNDNNPLIEDLNIEALNARNKKIFDINSKKHTTLKPKVNIPLAKLNENTQEQQQTNTEFENDESYQTSVNDFATTITSNTNTQHQQFEQEQEQEQSTTLDNTLVGTQNTDDANLSNNLNNLNEISSQDGFTTTPSPSTTLLHIFTLSDAGHTTQNPLDGGYKVLPRLIVERGNPKHKVVEINRIVEVNSKEEKLRRKSKANTIVAVEGSQTYKVESLPHVEQLGEISVVKYVHQVDGSDITIEGRSTVTDYTPTEPTVPWASQPVRHSLPNGNVEERYGKALVPEVIREAIETSTISLEGLFESARKGKVLNTIDDAAYVRQDTTTERPKIDELIFSTESSNNYRVETTTEKSNAESSTEGFNILKSIAFDIAKINLEPNSKEIETVNSNSGSILTSSSSSSSSSSSYTTKEKHTEQQEYSAASMLTTTSVPEIPKLELSTVAPEERKATTVAAALFPQYVRPIVPLLRPESNESSPLVISIANLDKVILSKVRKMVNGVEVEEDEQEHEHEQPEPQPQKPQQIENNIIPNSQTETLTTTNTNTNTILNNNSDQTQTQLVSQTQQNSEIQDSNGAFSSRLASVIKAPLLNSLGQTKQEVKIETNKAKSPLDKIEEVTQTELYTINEGSVGSTTSSTIGSQISETVSFSSETTVVRRKQPRKAKSRKFKTGFTTIAPATELVSES